ncbi:MAG: ABC transporter substrate-binding protein [Pseudomonadota bacterium]
MTEPKHQNANIPKLKRWYTQGTLPRREFLRHATLLGLSAGAAYSFAGLAQPFAEAQTLPKGGTLKMGMRVLDVSNPHAFSFNEGATSVRPVCDFLVRTGYDNITRPWLLSGWEVSDDLRSWTFKVREGVSWHNGRALTGEDVAWNIRHVLAPETGSSVVGLMGSYMLSEVETGESDDEGNPVLRSELWDANAIELVDPMTVRLNLKQPQVAVAEHLYHYPFFILDPEEGGSFGVGSNGTGCYTMVEHAVGEVAIYERVPGEYFMPGGHLDRIEIIDLGEDANASLGALMTGQVDGLYEISENQAPVVEANPALKIVRATTGATAVARGKMDQAPFDDPRVLKAMRMATDGQAVVVRALRDNASTGDHTHVSPIHPEWVDLGTWEPDIAGATALLAEAGYPDGIDIPEFFVKTQPTWELDVAQVLVEGWARAGIRVKIQTLPASSFWDRWTDYPFSLTSWGHRPLGMMVLSLAYRTGVPWNESSFSSARFDTLLDEIEGTVDPERQQEIMRELMSILREEGPIVQPFFMQVANAYNMRVKGIEMHPTKYIFFDQMAVET